MSSSNNKDHQKRTKPTAVAAADATVVISLGGEERERRDEREGEDEDDDDQSNNSQSSFGMGDASRRASEFALEDEEEEEQQKQEGDRKKNKKISNNKVEEQELPYNLHHQRKSGCMNQSYAVPPVLGIRELEQGVQDQVASLPTSASSSSGPDENENPTPSSSSFPVGPQGPQSSSTPGAFPVQGIGSSAASSSSPLPLYGGEEPSIEIGGISHHDDPQSPRFSEALSASLVLETYDDEEDYTRRQEQPADLQDLEEVMDVVAMPTTTTTGTSSSRQKWQFTTSKRFNFIGFILLIVGVFLAILLGLILPTGNDGKEDNPVESPPGPHGAALDPSSENDDVVASYPPFDDQLLETATIRAITEDPTSYQYKANLWMWNDPNLYTYPRWRKLQRFALATKYYSLSGHEWYHNDDWLSYDVSECDWWIRTGSRCNEVGEVAYEDLSSNNLKGSLPKEGQLSSLRYADQSNNHITGALPTISSLADMEVFIISDNNISGTITSPAGYVGTRLRIFKLDNNNMVGSQLGFMFQFQPNLEILNLTNNKFSGSMDTMTIIPVASGNNNNNTAQQPISRLKYLGLGSNQGSGTLPTQLGYLVGLEEFDISNSPLVHGTIPTELASLNNLTHLDVSGTSITGKIPPSLCSAGRTSNNNDDAVVIANCSQVECC